MPRLDDAEDIAIDAAPRICTRGARNGWYCGFRPSLSDQAIRASSSVPLNLSESDGRTGKDRRHLRRVAYASAKETKTALGMLADVEAIDRHRAESAIALMDRVCAMTWRLIGR